MRRSLIIGWLVILCVGGLGGAQLLRPVPAARAAIDLAHAYRAPGPALNVPLPTTGQAALYLEGTGWVAETPGQTPVAIASVTKLMTALLVVEAHPLEPGQAGPALTVSGEDQSVYQAEAAAGDSVVPVRVGESLTELQLLQGLLLPSGDNFARILAQWVSGSEGSFVAAMNRKAKALGMTHTVYADASGLNPGSISTASDLTKLAVEIMSQPVLAQVVALSKADLPVAGVVHNYDFVLGQQGVVGIKTGWTEEAGGCFVFAARKTVDGISAELLGAVLAQPGNAYSGIVAAEQDSLNLLAATWPRLELVTPIKEGQVVGSVHTRWGAHASLSALGPVHFLGWPGLVVALSASSGPIHGPVMADPEVGLVGAAVPGGPRRSDPVVADGPVPGPSWEWRLLDTHF